jgi:hypothetical protein
MYHSTRVPGENYVSSKTIQSPLGKRHHLAMTYAARALPKLAKNSSITRNWHI